MPSAKERIIAIVTKQPDDSSYGEILRELAFEKMIERGLKDSDSGRTHSNESVKERIEKWQR
mgnify:CR=1 FL=1|jgi:predicted transcriptional regulator